MSLHGKVALVTGASSGIGEACCLALLEQGAFVYGCARREERLDALKNRWGENFRGIVCDLREPNSIQQM